MRFTKKEDDNSEMVWANSTGKFVQRNRRKGGKGWRKGKAERKARNGEKEKKGGEERQDRGKGKVGEGKDWKLVRVERVGGKVKRRG